MGGASEKWNGLPKSVLSCGIRINQLSFLTTGRLFLQALTGHTLIDAVPLQEDHRVIRNVGMVIETRP